MKMNKLFKFFSKETPDLEFVDCTRQVYPHYPVVLAKDVKPFFKEFQEKDNGNYNFPGCPGMHDYSRMGYKDALAVMGRCAVIRSDDVRPA